MRCFENHKVVKFEDIKYNGNGMPIHKPLFCKVHKNEELKYFCNTCDAPICTECIVGLHQQPLHNYERLNEAETKNVDQLRQLINNAKEKIDNCQDEFTDLDDLLANLQDQLEAARGNIEETYQSYKAILEKRRDDLLKDLDEIHSKKELTIMDMHNSVDNSINKITDCVKFSERVLKNGNSVEVLLLKKQIINQMRYLYSNLTDTNLTINLKFETDKLMFEKAIGDTFGKLIIADDLDHDNRSELMSNSLENKQKHEQNEDNQQQIFQQQQHHLQMRQQQQQENFNNNLNSLQMNNENEWVLNMINRAQMNGVNENYDEHSPEWLVNMANLVAASSSATTTTAPSTSKSSSTSILKGVNGSSLTQSSTTTNEFHQQQQQQSPTSPSSSSSTNNATLTNDWFVNMMNLSKNSILNGGTSTTNTNTLSAANQQMILNNLTNVQKSLYLKRAQSPTSMHSDFNTHLSMNGINGHSLTNSRSQTPGGTTANTTPPLAATIENLIQLDNTSMRNLNQLTKLIAPQTVLNGETGTLAANLDSASLDSSIVAGLQNDLFSGNGNLNPPVRNNLMSSMQIRCKFGQLGPAKGQFNSPHGFCLGADEEIIVADTNNHRIQVFDKNGEFKYQFGVPGREEGQLWYPRKITVIRQSGKFIICDRGNERSRMQIFNKNGNFIKKIAIRYIDIVAGLAISQEGNIVAVDSVSPTVFIISEAGVLIKHLDCGNFMREPSDIAVSGNEYYVCDFKGHCVVVINEDGEFLRRIGGENITNFPNGIDVSDAGDVLVGDSHGNRFHIAVFSREGALLSEFECPYVKVSRCCGLKITTEGYVVTLAKNNHHVLVLNTLYVQ